MGRLLTAIGETIVPRRLRETLNPEIGIVGGDPDPDAYLYRALGTPARDISDLRMRRSNAVAYWLYLTNSYAKRAIELLVDFIIGTGVDIEAISKNKTDREITQEFLDKIWYGTPWSFGNRLDDYLVPLHIFGELILPFEVQQNGTLVFSYIDPESIEFIKLDKNNVLRADHIKLKDVEETWPVVNCENDATKLKKGVFLLQLNKLVNASRGNGVLLPTIDLLAMLDEYIYSETERATLIKSFVWDAELSGKTEAEIKKWTTAFGVPKPNSIFAHNESIKLNAVTPDLKGADMTHVFKLLFNSVAVGFGVPEHWLGAVGFDVNRATALEMNSPIFKRLERKQGRVKEYFELILDFALMKGRGLYQSEHGMLKESTDTSYNLNFPAVSPKNMNDLATTLKSIAESLAIAQMQKWASKKGARDIFKKFLETDMGYELPEDDEKLLDQEDEDTEKDDMDRYQQIMDKLNQEMM